MRRIHVFAVTIVCGSRGNLDAEDAQRTQRTQKAGRKILAII